MDLGLAVRELELKLRETRRHVYDNLTAWQRVQIARHNQRPFAFDYIQRCFTNWVELHGDRCFADDRAMQFKKFARFEPRSTPLDDASLAARIRDLTRQSIWSDPLPENQRIVFPGYKDLKEMSKARRELMQLNIGHGWPSYFRVGNARMVFQDGPGYQERTHAQLNAALARGELFVAFLTTYPRFSINHSVLIYELKSSSPNPGVDHYLVYDPNHAESPRDLIWSAHDRAFSYQKDWDFIGGFVRVYQVYGKPLQ